MARRRKSTCGQNLKSSMAMVPYLFLIMGDVVLVAAALYAGLSLQFGFKDALTQAGPVHFSGLVLIAISVAYLLELYDLNKRTPMRELFSRVLFSILGSLSAIVGIEYFLQVRIFSVTGLAVALAVLGGTQVCWHIGYRMIMQSRHLVKKVLILGTGPLAKKIGDLIQSADHQYILAGYFQLNSEPMAVAPHAVLGGGSRQLVAETAQKERADKVVVSITERRGAFPVRDVLNCKFRGIEVLDAPTFYEHLTGKLLLENITPSWFIFSTGFKKKSFMRICKRTADLFGSLTGLLLLAACVPFIAVLIKLDSRGPLLFRQVRVGRNDTSFVLYKFRTMCADAEDGTGAVWAQLNDPRVTRIGRVLRKTRVDELPQLYNVLKGDMSFIGPRPERPEFVEKLKSIVPYYSERHSVKPGITGWAQIKYPYGASAKDALEKLRYDLFYIKNMSVLLEMTIVLETIKVMLFGRGAR